MSEFTKIDESSWFFRYVVRRRVALGFAFALLFLLVAQPTRASVFAGLGLALAGEALRTWASGILVKRKQLSTGGPYRLVRNPLYVGNFLIGLGVAVMGGRPWLVAVFAVAFAVVYRALVQREEQFLLERYGEEFIAYCYQVPRFVPRWPVWPLPRAEYDPQRMFRVHREWQAWLALYAVTLYLLLRAP